MRPMPRQKRLGSGIAIGWRQFIWPRGWNDFIQRQHLPLLCILNRPVVMIGGNAEFDRRCWYYILPPSLSRGGQSEAEQNCQNASRYVRDPIHIFFVQIISKASEVCNDSLFESGLELAFKRNRLGSCPTGREFFAQVFALFMRF